MCNAVYRWFLMDIRCSRTLEDLEKAYKGSKEIEFPPKWELELFNLYREKKKELKI